MGDIEAIKLVEDLQARIRIDALSEEVHELRKEIQQLQQERDQLVQEKSALVAEREELLKAVQQVRIERSAAAERVTYLTGQLNELREKAEKKAE